MSAAFRSPEASDPDLLALGVRGVRGGEWEKASTADLLLLAIDIEGHSIPDPADALLQHASEWLRALIAAVYEGAKDLPLDARLHDIERQIDVAAELHRRQRAALLEALATARAEAKGGG